MDCDDGDTSSESSSSTASFKLNENSCIGLFNGLKALGERSIMSSPERRAYYYGLQNINTIESGLYHQQKKQTLQRKPSEENYDKPPQTLRDIFKISNRNRKKNKQKKKVCKVFDSTSDAGGVSTHSSEYSGIVENVNQIIAAQYKLDQMNGVGQPSTSFQMIK